MNNQYEYIYYNIYFYIYISTNQLCRLHCSVFNKKTDWINCTLTGFLTFSCLLESVESVDFAVLGSFRRDFLVDGTKPGVEVEVSRLASLTSDSNSFFGLNEPERPLLSVGSVNSHQAMNSSFEISVICNLLNNFRCFATFLKVCIRLSRHLLGKVNFPCPITNCWRRTSSTFTSWLVSWIILGCTRTSSPLSKELVAIVVNVGDGPNCK